MKVALLHALLGWTGKMLIGGQGASEWPDATYQPSPLPVRNDVHGLLHGTPGCPLSG